MNQISWDELINVVQQPVHAQQQLIGLQEKYGITTSEFLVFYKEGICLPISDRDIREWLFQREMFLITGGNPLHLEQLDSFDTLLPLIA